MTLRFFQNDQEQSCNYLNSSGALTFTTASVPVLSHCFNFVELFGGNATQGFVNQTRNLPGVWGEHGIHWNLENVDTFDPRGNYSGVLYRQHVTNAGNGELAPGKYAHRRVTIYGGENCTEKDPSNHEGLLDWYGFSCFSETEGSCGTLPYSIASFSVQAGPAVASEEDGTCWVFAKEGAAGRIGSSFQNTIGPFACASLALWLLL